MRIVILHAYSARNSGDGLLVDLSVAALRECFGEGAHFSVVAADPESFDSSRYDLLPAPIMASRGSARFRQMAMPTRAYEALRRTLDEADLIVAVGGGYMRSQSSSEAAKLFLGHLAQLKLAVASGRPLVCLPQSIGPFFHGRRSIPSSYRKAKAVFVRDDRSLKQLHALGNVSRVPDLAVQELARNWTSISSAFHIADSSPKSVCLVLRKPPAWGWAARARYIASLHELVRELKAQALVTFAVQSAIRGNDDAAFYRSIGVDTQLKSLKEMLAESRPDVVVSVRLHGALESLLAGVPAFHVSYERKGFGAYQDLGLDDWVVNGARFRASDVARKVLSRESVSSVASRVQLAVPRILEARCDMQRRIEAAIT